MSQTATIAFIGFFIVFMLYWGLIIYIGIPKEERQQKQRKYDERQILEQCRACKYAFFSLITYLTVYGMLADQGVVWCEPAFGVGLGIFLSLGIYLSYCILQDAYFAIGESKFSALFGINCIGIISLFKGIEAINDGTILKNGLITIYGLRFLLFAIILFLDLSVFLRKRLDKRS